MKLIIINCYQFYFQLLRINYLNLESFTILHNQQNNCILKVFQLAHNVSLNIKEFLPLHFLFQEQFISFFSHFLHRIFQHAFWNFSKSSHYRKMALYTTLILKLSDNIHILNLGFLLLLINELYLFLGVCLLFLKIFFLSFLFHFDPFQLLNPF